MQNDDKENDYNREEILARSREDNKNGDEMEKQYLYKGAFLATGVGFFLYGIISIVIAVLGSLSYEMNIVTFAIIGTMYTVFGVKATKRRPLFLSAGIVCLVTSLVTTVCWILRLCGVD